MERKSWKIESNKPGSDLAGEAAAALAASSIVFRLNIVSFFERILPKITYHILFHKDIFRMAGMTAYADECLEHAKQLFSFADNFRGKS